MNKKLVPSVDQIKLNFSVKPNKKSNDSDARNVLKVLFGKILITKDIVKNIGSNYGLKKVTAFVSFANYQDIALLSLKGSKDIGLAKLLKNYKTTSTLNMSFMMAPIFIKMAVSLFL